MPVHSKAKRKLLSTAYGILNQKHSDNFKLSNYVNKELAHTRAITRGRSPRTRGGLHIPIEKLETLLDKVNWSTQNFHWHIFKNGYADNVIAASIELVMEYTENKKSVRRVFVGGCN